MIIKKMKFDEKKFNLWFNAFILIGMLVAVIVTNVYKFQQPDARRFMLVFASIGALMGVVNTVLSANGNILTFLFGLIDVTIASVVAFDSSIRPGGEPVWGNFALHAFYFLPMQFVGWWQWRKRGATAKDSCGIFHTVCCRWRCSLAGSHQDGDPLRCPRAGPEHPRAGADVAGLHGAMDCLDSRQCLLHLSLGRQGCLVPGFQLYCRDGHQVLFLSPEFPQRAANLASPQPPIRRYIEPIKAKLLSFGRKSFIFGFFLLTLLCNI